MKKCINNKKSFGLLTIIMIMVVTSIISGLTAGIIVYSTYKKTVGISYKNISDDPALKEFLDVYSSITNDYYENVDKNMMIKKAIDAMMNFLGDNYTSYLDKSQTTLLEDSLAGEYRGIGIVFSDHTIKSVLDNSPASEAGIKAGDKIVKINGEDVTDVDSNKLPDLIKNGGASVSISILRNNEEKEFNLSLSNLYIPAISYSVVDNTSVGYLRIAKFSSTLTEQVKEALNKLEEQNITSLIIDVRANSGGFLNAAEGVASLFIEKDRIIYSLKSKKENSIYKDRTDEKRDYPIIVLIDENSASASEILAAALKDSYGAKLVGKNSFGKGKVQQTHRLTDGSMVKYTTAKWYTPNDVNIDGKGLIPDVDVDLEVTKDAEGNITNVVDTQLKKAVELLSN